MHGLQWAIGLELFLLVQNPWQVFLTTDHPNGGCFWRYPEIVQLLMDVDFRREQIRKLPPTARERKASGIGDEVGAFIHPHPSLSEAFGEAMLAFTGRSLHG